MSTNALVSTALRTVTTGARGEQVVGWLLSTIPLAERMLLYNVAMTAWVMLPDRGLVGKSLLSCRERLGLSRQARCAGA
jgi:hypothetical protein